MHEMAIAAGILDIVLAYAKRQQAQRVNAVGLLVGEMTGVAPQSLELCFRTLAKDTVAQSADLRVERTPLVARCLDCGRQDGIEKYSFFCPTCGSARLETVSGRELRVAYLEVD